ncbi:hypothetical protein HBH56_145110 [Parastagonospora nodorum]|nr:hypothetical protein HBH56_145110 [Parastagonospora nodorum]KAH3927844.1 hypothetical protein HBH54_150300 [Parastagonospora nodorum]KAH3947901.1 hypothetical protein HBH53_110340 [Parastagonospora nodorum]KAH3960129.1 hypothetical protein HBH51_194160 [Parastagonospora nodorum]KAH4020564.1 hypothetical protein HBI13_116530 [Parastagonospora nodorum]
MQATSAEVTRVLECREACCWRCGVRWAARLANTGQQRFSLAQGWACRETDGGKAIVVAPGTLRGDWALGVWYLRIVPAVKGGHGEALLLPLGTVSRWTGRRLAEAASAAVYNSHGA